MFISSVKRLSADGAKTFVGTTVFEVLSTIDKTQTSSTQHGSSFAQLQKRISGEGPCLVIIKSSDERIFGCFASEGTCISFNY